MGFLKESARARSAAATHTSASAQAFQHSPVFNLTRKITNFIWVEVCIGRSYLVCLKFLWLHIRVPQSWDDDSSS